MRVNERHRQRFGAVVGKNFDQFAGAQHFANAYPWNLNNPQSGQTRRLIGLGTIDRKHAARFNPANRAIADHFKSERTNAQIAGVVDQRMIREIVQRLRIAKARQILRTGAVNLRELA